MNRRKFFGFLGLPMAAVGVAGAAAAGAVVARQPKLPVHMEKPPAKRGPAPGGDFIFGVGEGYNGSEGGRVVFRGSRFELTLTDDGLYYSRRDK